jgi:hypothetical protein
MKEVNYLRELGNEKVFEISAIALILVLPWPAFVDHQIVIFINIYIKWSY